MHEGRPAYRFHSTWTVPGPATAGIVWDVLQDVAAYPSWWRSVPAVGRLAEDAALVVCRSRLPKTLYVELRPVRQDRAAGVLEASLTGDLVGWSRFELGDRDHGVTVDYRQEVRTPGRLLTAAGVLLRPVLEWNHAQMMRALESDLAARVGACAR